MSAYVVDASVVASYLAPDEVAAPGHAAILEGGAPLLAPWLIWAEFRNVLVVKVRRGRIEAGQVGTALAVFDALALALDTGPDGDRVLDLVHAHDLSVYDALYLELATRRGAPLLTLDRRLARAAEAEGAAPGG